LQKFHITPPVLDRTFRKSNTGDDPYPFTLTFSNMMPTFGMNPRLVHHAFIVSFDPGSCMPNWLHGNPMMTTLSPNRAFNSANSS
jgi:hypothetical protein